jgi:hypothetical protein
MTVQLAHPERSKERPSLWQVMALLRTNVHDLFFLRGN